MSDNMIANTVLAIVALSLGTVAMLAFLSGATVPAAFALIAAAIATWGIF